MKRISSVLDSSALRIMLSGESVIDWQRLDFETDAEIETFIRLQEFNLDQEVDREHVGTLQREAFMYMEDVLRYHIPEEVKRVEDVRGLLRYASQRTGLKRNRVYACMALKVMHILHHLLARELLFNAPLSEAQLGELLSKKIYEGIDRMRATGLPIVEYAGGRKTRHSLVTKLLAKRETIASQIFDKTRFRVVVRSPGDLVPSLLFMVHEIFPFNYMIPGQADNSLLDLYRVADELALPERLRKTLLHNRNGAAQIQNEFSGRSYKTINFVVDVPLRVPNLRNIDPPIDQNLGEIVFVLAEFQLMDETTAENNERGENNHARYKARQEQRVRTRLEAGTLRKKKKKKTEKG
jgi:uncharacterized protein (TIGR04552 family)